MFENWKKNVDKGEKCGALFVDLSKAFDCLLHDLLLAKLNACGLIENLFYSFQVLQATGNKEQRLIHLLANGNISLLAYLRDLSWESKFLILFELFRENYLKANSGKAHVILTKDNKLKINIKDSLISNKNIVKLLGLTVNNELSFKTLYKVHHGEALELMNDVF